MGSFRVFALCVVLLGMLLDTLRLNDLNYKLKENNNVQAALYAHRHRLLGSTVRRFEYENRTFHSRKKDDAKTPKQRLIVSAMKLALSLKFEK